MHAVKGRRLMRLTYSDTSIAALSHLGMLSSMNLVLSRNDQLYYPQYHFLKILFLKGALPFNEFVHRVENFGHAHNSPITPLGCIPGGP